MKSRSMKCARFPAPTYTRASAKCPAPGEMLSVCRRLPGCKLWSPGDWQGCHFSMLGSAGGSFAHLVQGCLSQDSFFHVVLLAYWSFLFRDLLGMLGAGSKHAAIVSRARPNEATGSLLPEDLDATCVSSIVVFPPAISVFGFCASCHVGARAF